MPDKPKKRPWFQFSLSTALVMMFVAAMLLGLNVKYLSFNFGIEANFGFPFLFYYEVGIRSRHWFFQTANLVINVCFLIVALVMVKASCEYRIHRRRGKKARP